MPNRQTRLALAFAALAWVLELAVFIVDIDHRAVVLLAASVPAAAGVALGEWGRRLARRGGQPVAATYVAQWIGAVPAMPVITFAAIPFVAFPPFAVVPLTVLGVMVVVSRARRRSG